MIEFPEFDYVVVKRVGSGLDDVKASGILAAFTICGLWLGRAGTIEDLGDRVRITDRFPYGPSRSDFVFLLNGEVHIPGYEIVALHRAYSKVRDDRIQHRWLSHLSVRRWSIHDLRFPAPSLGCERRANCGVPADEEMLSAGIRVRAKRRFAYCERRAKQGDGERCWKRFRGKQWKEGAV